MPSTPLADASTWETTERLSPCRPDFPVHRFLVAEYLRLVDEGFYNRSRVELWEGWVVDRMTHGSLASSVIMILSELLRDLIDRDHSVRIQLPLVCGESCPEPDIAIVQGSASQYRRKHPTAAETQLVIEVSDSTLADDRRHKQRIYARAGIPSYWIVNCSERQIESFTEPTGDTDEPRYRQTQVIAMSESVLLKLQNRDLGLIPVAQLFD